MKYFPGYPRRGLESSLVLVLATVLFGLLGCESKDSAQDREVREANAKVEAVREKVDPLYRAYLTGSREEARNSLRQILTIIEASDERPAVQAHDLWLTYSRLYVLERRAGNDSLAQAYLLRARHWLLRKAELGGDDAEKAAREVFSWFSPDNCMDIVDHWDKSRTQGKGPKYAQETGTDEHSQQESE